MITAETAHEAHSVALGIMEGENEAFNWRDWYLQKAEAFNTAARSWRSIAHTAQLDGDEDVVRMAHMNALENENWAKDAESKAKSLTI
jgi:hypothetical protein